MVVVVLKQLFFLTPSFYRFVHYVFFLAHSSVGEHGVESLEVRLEQGDNGCVLRGMSAKNYREYLPMQSAVVVESSRQKKIAS